MAGLDHETSGRGRAGARRHASGSCRRSPTSTPPRTCGATSSTASPRPRACCAASRRSARGSARPIPTRWRSCSPSTGEVQDADRAPQRLGPGSHARDRDGRAAPAAGRPDVTKLSGGERRRVALCRLLLSKPDLLLLDEPTNHLDAESVAWLERHLEEYAGTVVAVTHDRYFLDNVAGWILELDRGRGIPWKGNYSSWLEQKRSAAGAGGEGRVGPPEGPRAASWSGCAARPGPGRPRARRASPATSSCWPRRAQRARRDRRDPHPAPRRAWATWWSRPRASPRGTATGC